jgi:hypothetical protein
MDIMSIGVGIIFGIAIGAAMFAPWKRRKSSSKDRNDRA